MNVNSMNTSIRRIPERIDAALQSEWQVRAMAIVDAIVVNVVILTTTSTPLCHIERQRDIPRRSRYLRHRGSDTAFGGRFLARSE